MTPEERAATVQRLGGAMSDLQESCFCASWMCVTPTIVGLCRRAIRTDTRQFWGNGELSVRTAREMWAMAESLGGWAEPDANDDRYVVGYPFTPLESEGLPGEDVESWIVATEDSSAPQDELDLSEKLLRTFHLSVPDRALLVGGRARLSTLVAAAARYLDETHTLPEGWRSPMPYDGVVIERRGDDYWLHERHEIGMLRYSPVKSRKASDLTEAVRYYVQRFGKDGQLDGIPIDFDQ
jgi:hypothetical protein